MHHPARPRGAQHSDDHHAGPAGGKTGRIRKTKSYVRALTCHLRAPLFCEHPSVVSVTLFLTLRRYDDYYEEDELTANPYAFGAGTGAAPPGVVAPQSHVPSPLQTAYASAGLPNHSPIANGARKPGGRECMHLLRKSGGHPLNESNLSQIVDYAFRGKVEQVAILRDSIGLLHDTIIDLFAKEVSREGERGGKGGWFSDDIYGRMWQVLFCDAGSAIIAMRKPQTEKRAPIVKHEDQHRL